MTQLLPSLPVAQLASPITDTIKQVPKILNDLTRDKNLELNLNVNTGTSENNNDKNQTLTSNRTASPMTTVPTSITLFPTTNEIYNNFSMEKEKIATKIPMQIINQPNTTVIPNNTNDEPTKSPNVKRTTAISVKCNYLYL